jgi:hypothetical protein
MKESLLIFIVLTLVCAIIAGVVLFSQKPTNLPDNTAIKDSADYSGVISPNSLKAPSGSVKDYTKEESDGADSGIAGFFRNLF